MKGQDRAPPKTKSVKLTWPQLKVAMQDGTVFKQVALQITNTKDVPKTLREICREDCVAGHLELTGDKFLNLPCRIYAFSFQDSKLEDISFVLCAHCWPYRKEIYSEENLEVFREGMGWSKDEGFIVN